MSNSGISGIGGINNINLTTVENNIKKVSDESFARVFEKAMEKKDEEKLREVCRQFEGILLSMLYSEMKKSALQSDLIPRSAARRIFEEMLDQKLMENAAERSSMGLADMLYNQLVKGLKRSDDTAGDNGIDNSSVGE